MNRHSPRRPKTDAICSPYQLVAVRFQAPLFRSTIIGHGTRKLLGTPLCNDSRVIVTVCDGMRGHTVATAISSVPMITNSDCDEMIDRPLNFSFDDRHYRSNAYRATVFFGPNFGVYLAADSLASLSPKVFSDILNIYFRLTPAFLKHFFRCWATSC